jgi:multicomponent K+:H+ antiporter subunit C
VAALIASLIGVLFACGVYLVLRQRTFSVVLGLTLMSYGTNLFLLAMGRAGANAPPIVLEGVTDYADPLPQALVLTAIVIGFGMTAFLVVLAIRTRIETRTDHVDGRESSP